MNRVSIVCLGVRDLRRSIRFYTDLGFEPADDPDKDSMVLFFNNQGSRLELCDLQLLAKDIDGQNPPPLPQPGFSGVTLACNVESEALVDETLALAASCGGTVVKPGQKVFWGGYSGYFTDPDGHYWEVAYNPFAPIGSDGMPIVKA